MNIDWVEELPPKCPPSEAQSSAEWFYRLVENIPLELSDFCSQRKLFPNKVFESKGVTECQARACSIFCDLNSIKRILKYPMHKSKKIVRLKMEDSYGVILKTGQEHHYSWWVTSSFNPEKCEYVNE